MILEQVTARNDIGEPIAGYDAGGEFWFRSHDGWDCLHFARRKNVRAFRRAFRLTRLGRLLTWIKRAAHVS